jgi:hypothetical protein
MKKISICGPTRNEITELGICKTLGSKLGSLSRLTDIVIATGGGLGIPLEVIREAKIENPESYIEAYTPCKDVMEWDSYLEKGMVMPRDFYENIIYSKQEGDIKTRGLLRIPLLVIDSNPCIVYLNGYADNTNVELFSSLSLGVSTWVLTREEKILQSVRSLASPKADLRIFNDAEALTSELDYMFSK